MKILLLYPPQWTPNSPYLALPLLSAQLKKRGFETDIMDLNIEFFNRILKKSNLEMCLDAGKAFCESFRSVVNEKYVDAEQNFEKYSLEEKTKLLKYKMTVELFASANDLNPVVDKAEEAVQVLKSKELFYNPEILFQAKKTR